MLLIASHRFQDWNNKSTIRLGLLGNQSIYGHNLAAIITMKEMIIYSTQKSFGQLVRIDQSKLSKLRVQFAQKQLSPAKLADVKRFFLPSYLSSDLAFAR